MKKFTVEINQLKSLSFEVNAKNKKSARQMITDFINKVDLNNLDLNCLKKENVKVVVNRLRK